LSWRACPPPSRQHSPATFSFASPSPGTSDWRRLCTGRSSARRRLTAPVQSARQPLREVAPCPRWRRLTPLARRVPVPSIELRQLQRQRLQLSCADETRARPVDDDDPLRLCGEYVSDPLSTHRRALFCHEYDERPGLRKGFVPRRVWRPSNMRSGWSCPPVLVAFASFALDHVGHACVWCACVFFFWWLRGGSLGPLRYLGGARVGGASTMLVMA
jgi:hypothetical protein